MFEKFKKLIAEAKKQAVSSVDPEVFNHPVAQQTDWHPLRSGGANFGTHKLDSSSPDKLVFKATIGAQLFAGVFTLSGLLGLIIPIVIFINQGMHNWSLLLFALFFGGIFLAAGLFMFYFFALPKVFDTFYGLYYTGWKQPKDDFKTKSKVTELNQVAALQILRERVRSKNGSYYSYELNLILKDASRVNVIDHGNHNQIIEDATSLAESLGVPLWNGS